MTRPRQTVAVLRVEQLKSHPGNIREGLGGIDDMARSIREHGIVQPLTVTEHAELEDTYVILDGHRRFAGAMLAQESKVPVVIRHDVVEVDHTVLMLVTGTHRRELKPVERARGYARLRDDFGLNMSEIARRCGTHASQVSTYLNLLRLDEETLERVEAGDVPVGVAIATARAERRTEREEAGTPRRGRPSKAYFGREHPLAAVVATQCTHATYYGGVGCGPCWEAAIRENALGDQAVAS